MHFKIALSIFDSEKMMKIEFPHNNALTIPSDAHSDAQYDALTGVYLDGNPAEALNTRSTDQEQIPHQALKYVLSPLFTRTWLTRDATNIIQKGSFVIQPSELHISTKVGNGRFGTVFRAMYNGQTCAVKTLMDDDAHGVQYERLLLELSVLAGIGKHPNLVSFLGACIQENSAPMIVEELVNGPDLGQFLSSKPPDFDLGKPTVPICSFSVLANALR
jgi:hypothetical protein